MYAYFVDSLQCRLLVWQSNYLPGEVMAKGIAAFRPPLLSFFNLLTRHIKAQHTLTEAGECANEITVPPPEQLERDSSRNAGGAISSSASKPVHTDASEWKVLNSRVLGIQNSKITPPIWIVLRNLREKGYEAYLVGGCVRDLILRKTPKDFDVVTAADPPQIRKKFPRCYIVGKRFPICHVHVANSTIEVSSFGTSGKDVGSRFKTVPERPAGCDDHDYVRWKDCIKRDFTINGLIYDPFANVVYDYIGGVKDLRMAKVRTVIPAHASFEEDCARILRAFRIAGRLGFQFTTDTAHAIQDLSLSILRLDKSRLMMEMNYILAYGAAEASLRLLGKFKLLEILLPIQAAYLTSWGFKEYDTRSDKQSNMLLALFTNLDKLLAADRPCHSILWVAILAFHLALVDEPRDALLVTTFSFVLYYGGDLKKAMNAARKRVEVANRFCPEIIEAVGNKSDKILTKQVFNLALSAKSSLNAMINEESLSEAMSKYPEAPFSNLVFISKAMHTKVCKLFDVAQGKLEYKCNGREHSKINYESLVNGDLEEVRYVFARVILETMYSDSDLGDHQNPPVQSSFCDNNLSALFRL